jgi:hypothetical protein
MLRILVLLSIPLVAAACAEKDKYPLSGDQCHEGDPVQQMTPPDCLNLPTGTGTF